MSGIDGSYRVEALPLAGTRRVFAGTRVGDEARVVVKRARPGCPPAQEAAALRHEFTVLSQLKGTPVVEAQDFIEGPGAGLVLAVARGRSVDGLIAGGAVPEVTVFVALAVEMTRALAGVHARGFVHRDIKPHHFFIDDESGEARLLDFGLATHLPRERQVPVQLDEIQGTLSYISPEQTGRTSHSVDQRSDLYSLGVTLYQLAAGRLPFESADALELVHAHIARLPAPLRQLRPDLPETLEAMVMRLLAKSPDERYQTAAGLLADLEHARAELARTGTVTSFALGEHDYDGTLRLPEKLYGRAEARRALLSAVRSAQDGARALTLLTGAPGVGKSALVYEAHREIVRRGHFVSGKFDQLSRGVPYSAITAACGELVRLYLAATANELDAWQRRLRAALGDNARVLADVIPELALALGDQPEVAPLPPNEAQVRFERTFRRFMEASACSEAPLVLFLDDLQWADTASLAALELILSADGQGHLLIIGSYRDSEVDAAHPLSRLLERLEPRARLSRIRLEALSLMDVRELVSDALRSSSRASEELASLIFEKTSGNPFFVGQFLERLATEKHLRFEPGRGYTWDLSAIAALRATDNVVDLVVARLDALSGRVRELLKLAGCIGHSFRLRTLALIAEDDPRVVLRELEPALMGGFLVPLGQNHHLFADLLAGSQGEAADMVYRFAHDRVQQAALATSDAKDRARVHLRIGRLMLAAAGADGPSDEQLFETTAQLNLGRELVTDPSERLELARLNLRASRRARSAAAHASALQLASTCIELFGPRPFTAEYEVSLAAHGVAIEAAYLLHDEPRALELIASVEGHAKCALDRVSARNLRAAIVTNQGRPRDATAISVETLALLGVRLPDIGDEAAIGAAIGAAFGAYQAALGAREVASLYELPAMTDPEKLAVLGTMAGAIPAIFQWNHALMVLLVLQAVQLPLEYGTAPVSPFFYAQYGIVHHVVTGDPLRAHEFGLLALALAERPEHAAARGGVEFIYAEFLAPWVRPRAECATHFKRGVTSGLDAGDLVHAGFCTAVGAAEALYAGQSLDELQKDTTSGLKALREQGDVLNHLLLDIVDRSLACLRGETATLGALDGEGFDERQFEASGPPPVLAHYGAIKGMLRYLYGDAAEARRVTEAMQPPPGVAFKVDYAFYHGMACVELARSAAPADQEALLSQAEADLTTFAPWVRVAPRNFSAQEELLRAELLSARDDDAGALRAFTAAIEAAARIRAPHHLALAQERLGRFHLRQDRPHLAQLSLAAAAREYELWGATGKLVELNREFPRVHAAIEPPRYFDTTAETMTAAASTGGGSRLDLQSAMRAVSAMASEIRLEPLLQRLTRILMENAGATRTVLLLAEGAEFVIRAAMRVRSEQLFTEALDTDLDHALAASAVRYAARTLQAVVVDDAGRDNRFAQDPFVEERKAKSIACIPLVHQGGLIGMLYLENDTAAGTFHAARVERLEFLAGHAAISLQNARLYEELQAANDNLERRVQARTTELSERNQDMRRVLDNVKQGLLTIDLAGRMMPEHSRVVDEWLGRFQPGTSFEAYLAEVDPRFVSNFGLAFQQLLDDELPTELLIDQLPTALARGERHFHLTYQPIYGHDKLAGLLVVIDDVTEALQRARDDAEQRDVQALFRHFSKDRAALLSFFEENGALAEDLKHARDIDATVRRSLHTLKGNAALYGFATLTDSCNAAEEALAEAAFQPSHVDAVVQSFSVLQRSLVSIAGDDAGERIEVSRATLRALVKDLASGLSTTEATRVVERLLLEPVRPTLERLGRYARALASRLGKAEPIVEVADGGLFVDGKRAAPLFASLVHLVRNAVDHGLETRSEREASGKSQAVLWLRAALKEGEVVIEIQDDGRGIDWESVRERARAQGLAAATRGDLMSALLSDRFSTRDDATCVSGRGVGLAAVHAEVTHLSGRVVVESELGRGSRVCLCLASHALGAIRG